jgi:TonB-dependent SusC/RagA subfamily outer membrane receptor
MKTLKIVSFFLLAIFATKTVAQEKKKPTRITISVKDDKNKPVAGAAILFDDKKHPRRTNKKGIFKIKIKDTPKEIAAFSALLGIKKVKYTGQKNIYIILGNDQKNDVEIVGRKAQDTAAGAMQFLTIYDYLRGKVSGVTIDGNRIRIRGISNLSGGRSPLLVLNGVPVDADSFGDIVPTTIRKVKVLKGPDSAIYGLRGANGVIEVTTEL